MSDSLPDAASGSSDGADPSPISAPQFARFVIGLNRFLSGLASHSRFQPPGLGLTEWLALVQVAQNPLPSRNLAREVGLTKQQGNKLAETLRAGGLLTLQASATLEGHSDLVITPQGLERLNSMNAALIPALGQMLEGRELALTRAEKSLQQVAKVLREPKAAREPKAPKHAADANADDDGNA